MKTLMLLRHAKSDWSAPSGNDRERQLNKRGQLAASRMGQFIQEEGIKPDEVFCSSAARTSQTCDLLLAEIKDNVQLHNCERLYGADEFELMRHAATAAPKSQSILLLAHNPGIHALALNLTSQVKEGVDARTLSSAYPTGALAVLTFDVNSWQDIGPHTGTLTCFQAPKDLKD
jgi:phosphohistidine phosphatase